MAEHRGQLVPAGEIDGLKEKINGQDKSWDAVHEYQSQGERYPPETETCTRLPGWNSRHQPEKIDEHQFANLPKLRGGYQRMATKAIYDSSKVIPTLPQNGIWKHGWNEWSIGQTGKWFYQTTGRRINIQKQIASLKKKLKIKG